MAESEKEFEQEVLRIAQALWPTSQISGQIIIDGRERDGVFITEEVVHLLECTISTRKDKAIADGEKLAKLIKSTRHKYPSKGVKGWFVTLNPPTADQRAVIAQYQNDIFACSITEFRNKLVEATSYLDARLKYPFGSMRDPDTEKRTIEADGFKYVSIDIVAKDRAKWSIGEISEGLLWWKRLYLVRRLWHWKKYKSERDISVSSQEIPQGAIAEVPSSSKPARPSWTNEYGRGA